MQLNDTDANTIAVNLSRAYDNTIEKYLTQSYFLVPTPTRTISMGQSTLYVQLDENYYALSGTTTVHVHYFKSRAKQYTIDVGIPSYCRIVSMMTIPSFPDYLLIWAKDVYVVNWRTSKEVMKITNERITQVAVLGSYIVYVTNVPYSQTKLFFVNIEKGPKHVKQVNIHTSTGMFLFVPNGRFILIDSYQLYMYDLKNSKYEELMTMSEELQTVSVVDSRRVMIVSRQQYSKNVTIFNYETKKIVKKFSDAGLVNSIVLPQNGLLWWTKCASRKSRVIDLMNNNNNAPDEATIDEIPALGTGNKKPFKRGINPTRITTDRTSRTMLIYYGNTVEVYSMDVKVQWSQNAYKKVFTEQLVDIKIFSL
jgi:hypothetical protein